MQVVRDRLVYQADGTAGAKGEGERDEVPCTKYSSSHNELTPGLFIIFCVHGFCMAFKAMAASEGPSTAFDMLYHRLKSGAYRVPCHAYSTCPPLDMSSMYNTSMYLRHAGPKMIVYDNCCNLHKYALRRQPSFFFKTRFVIDRMHAKGH
eukprot:163109-Chlamydomonas_euryale.AAC.1